MARFPSKDDMKVADDWLRPFDYEKLWIVLRLNTLADELVATREEQERIIADIQQSMDAYIKSTEQRIKELRNGNATPRTK